MTRKQQIYIKFMLKKMSTSFYKPPELVKPDRLLGVFVVYLLYLVIIGVLVVRNEKKKEKIIHLLILVLFLILSGIITYVHLLMNVGDSFLIKW